MHELKPGDRIRLFGGYDMDPHWLKNRGCHFATILRFIDNNIAKRSHDERLSAVIEFDDGFECKGFKGKFGILLGRWEGQLWEAKGVVHVYLLAAEIKQQEEMTRENSCHIESHASYEKLNA